MIKRILNWIRNRRMKKESNIVAEANKFFDEFRMRQLLEDKQLDETISNYYN